MNKYRKEFMKETGKYCATRYSDHPTIVYRDWLEARLSKSESIVDEIVKAVDGIDCEKINITGKMKISGLKSKISEIRG